jgi:hypothetical protein
MPPLISSTTGIGDEKFNLTVKPYELPKQSKSGVTINIASFTKTDSSLPSGSSRVWTIFSDFNRVSIFYIDKIFINCYRTNSSGAIQTISTISATLSNAGGSNWTGLSGWVTTAQPTNLTTTAINFQSNPSSYTCFFEGPILYNSTSIRLEATAYATIALNDIIYWTCLIYWRA